MTNSDPSRTAFERHMLKTCENSLSTIGMGTIAKLSDGTYEKASTQERWLTWQTAMALKVAELWQPLPAIPIMSTNGQKYTIADLPGLRQYLKAKRQEVTEIENRITAIQMAQPARQNQQIAEYRKFRMNQMVGHDLIRAGFEAYMLRQNACTRLHRQSEQCGGAYRTVSVERDWQLWQAALAYKVEKLVDKPTILQETQVDKSRNLQEPVHSPTSVTNWCNAVLDHLQVRSGTNLL